MGQNYSCQDCCSQLEGQRKEVVIGRDHPQYVSHQNNGSVNNFRPREPGHGQHESITSIVKNDSVTYRSNKHMQAYISNQNKMAMKITDDEKMMDLLLKNIHFVVKL